MKQIVLLLAIAFSLNCNAQKDSTFTDTTAMVSVADVNKALNFLYDKLRASDYDLVKNTLQGILNEAYQRRKKK